MNNKSNEVKCYSVETTAVNASHDFVTVTVIKASALNHMSLQLMFIGPLYGTQRLMKVWGSRLKIHAEAFIEEFLCKGLYSIDAC